MSKRELCDWTMTPPLVPTNAVTAHARTHPQRTYDAFGLQKREHEAHEPLGRLGLAELHAVEDGERARRRHDEDAHDERHAAAPERQNLDVTSEEIATPILWKRENNQTAYYI